MASELLHKALQARMNKKTSHPLRAPKDLLLALQSLLKAPIKTNQTFPTQAAQLANNYVLKEQTKN